MLLIPRHEMISLSAEKHLSQSTSSPRSQPWETSHFPTFNLQESSTKEKLAFI